MAAKTLFEKVWDDHLVRSVPGEPDLLYVDLHLVHEVTSPQAFDSLRVQKRPVRRPDLTLATIDHGVPTANRQLGITDPMSKIQIDAMVRNCDEFGVTLFGLNDPRSGIVHIIGPEQGVTQPGMLIVCGDSHTSTHGAFGALAFGIGTSEVEHVLATQTLPQDKPKAMAIRVEGDLPTGVTPKDIILGVIANIGTGGATGHVIEYMGSTIRSLSMEGRMTICNMSIEAGARAGLIAPDETTFAYMRGRPFVPKDWDEALEIWRQLPSDDGATFDTTLEFAAADLEPFISWGTNPGQSIPISGRVPSPDEASDPSERDSIERALAYMDLPGGIPATDIRIDRVFLGSCTNGRIEDLRAAAALVEGRTLAEGVSAMVVPGSGLVKLQAETEGLDVIFKEAGFEWRDAGCSMCLGMNPDILAPGERCASTSNRNFEGRQGPGGRTHLMSPAMAAAAAISGHLVDVRDWI